MCPSRAFYEWVCCFFSPKMWGFLRPQYPPKIQTSQHLAKNKQAYSSKARQGHIKHVCKISGAISQKRRGHWYLKEFGVLCLNQPLFKLRHLLQVVWTRLNSYRCVNKAVSYITAKWASYYSSFKRKSSQKFSTIRVLCLLLGLTVFPILLVAAIPVTIFSYSGLNPSQLQP